MSDSESDDIPRADALKRDFWNPTRCALEIVAALSEAMRHCKDHVFIDRDTPDDVVDLLRKRGYYVDWVAAHDQYRVGVALWTQ